ncbi:MAG: cobalt ECF transporter T component CbiQ [Rhodobacteraceae bacterium]|nr:cobalt ECF transporter T component CbiQ [Paracoccaceae bacterium]
MSRRAPLLERMTGHLLHALDHARLSDDLTARGGFLQALDPRVKLGGLLGLAVTVTAVHRLTALAGLFLAAVLLALASRLPVGRALGPLWLGILIFSGAIALPAPLLTPGDVVAHLPLTGWPITAQGLRSAAFLIGRAETAATFTTLLILTTPWPHVLKAMRALGVPVVVVAIFGMTHRYIFLFLQAAAQMFEARRSRMVGRLTPREGRRLAVATAGALLGRAIETGNEVHLAMISRGYRGEPRLMQDFPTRPRDWAALAGAGSLAALALFGGA